MKKMYVKPRLGLDLFTLFQAVPMVCDYSSEKVMGWPTQGNGEDCTWCVGDDFTVFLESNENCLMKYEEFEWDWFCYNNLESGEIVFGS